MSAVLISMAYISSSINAMFVTPFLHCVLLSSKRPVENHEKIVLTNHFVSYPKREQWEESSSPYSSLRRILDHIEFKPTWKLTRMVTVAYHKNHLLRFPK